MGRVVEKDMVEVHLDDSRLVHTCCCYYTMEVPVSVLVDTDPWACQGNMALEQQHAPEPEQLGLGLLVLVAYSVPRLAAVAVYLEQVIG